MRSFKNSLDILVKAFMNDTLEQGVCYACAVGNLISANGVYLEKYDRDTITVSPASSSWLRYIHFVLNGNKMFKDVDKELAQKQICSTGYTIEELRDIEFAFENSEDVFSGLMAVVDVLSEIHNIDLVQREDMKKLFIRA